MKKKRPGPKPKAEKDKLSAFLRIPVRKAQLSDLRKRANESGLYLTEYVRLQLFGQEKQP